MAKSAIRAEKDTTRLIRIVDQTKRTGRLTEDRITKHAADLGENQKAIRR